MTTRNIVACQTWSLTLALVVCFAVCVEAQEPSISNASAVNAIQEVPVGGTPQTVHDPTYDELLAENVQLKKRVAELELQPVPSSDTSFLVTVVAGAVLLLLVVLFVFNRRQPAGETKNTPSDMSDMTVHVGQPPVYQKVSKDLPLGIFPSEWFSKTDEKKLDDYVTGAKKHILDEFFKDFSGDLALPSNEKLQAASEKLGRRLNDELLRKELLEILNGGEVVAVKESNYLISHLNELVPPLKLPHPINIQYDLPRTTLALVAAVGAVLGFLLGGLVIGYIGNGPAETGHLVGAVAGAAIFSFAALSISSSHELQNWLRITAGTMALGEIAIQVLKGTLVPSFLLKRAKSSILKRMLFYIGLFLLPILLKRTKTYDHDRFRDVVESTIEQYIRSVLPITAVLLLRKSGIGGEPIPPPPELIREVLRIAFRTRLQDSDDRDELIQELKKIGQTETVETLVWNSADASLTEKYETFGIIEDGVLCEVTKPPILQNDKVVDKGLVKKKK